MTQKTKFLRQHRSQRGFSLLEVMISMIVMTIGMMAVLLSFGTAIEATEWAQEDLIARHKALDALESIYTARNSQQLPYASINNVANGGVFVGGAQTLLCAGADGIGSARPMTPLAPRPTQEQLVQSGIECLVLPGPDGILGTPDDLRPTASPTSPAPLLLTQSCRRLMGGPTNPSLIAVTVTIFYTKPGRSGLTPAATRSMR
jgi:prepilin-type N-terminal cleavage/methylation domain-containing protein